MNIQEAYRTPNRLDLSRNTSRHIIIKTPNALNKERISDPEDTIETIDSTVKENAKCKKLVSQNIQEIQDKMRRPNLRIIGIDESEDLQQRSSTKLWKKTFPT